MTVTIKIDCNNAAFEESASEEVARILRDLANKVLLTELRGGFSLCDINGNKVGQFAIQD